MCHGTFVHFSQDICPKNAGHLSGHFWDICGQTWDKNGTGVGQWIPIMRILPLKWEKMGHLSLKCGTFVHFLRDICPDIRP